MNTVTLGSLFHFIRNGMNIKQDKSGRGLPITRIETISDAVIDPTRVGYAGLTEEEASNWLLKPGDILFSHINSVPHIGKCAVYQGQPPKLVHGMNLLCLRSDRAKLLPEFAKYLLRSGQFRTQLSNSIKKAVNQASVSIGDLREIPVTVPSLPEQQRIAEILDRADALRARRRAALAQLDTLTQSIFLEMFGDLAVNPKQYESRKLGLLVRRDDAINYGVVQPGDDVTGGIPLIRVVNFQEGKVCHQDLKRISPAIESAYKRSRLRGDEILVSCVGSLGIVAIADESVKGFNINRAVARIPLANGIDPVYIASYLRTEFVQGYFLKEIRTGNQPRLNIKQISETPVVLPPISLQKEFARRAAVVEELKMVQRVSLVELISLFASLQHRAFRGEL